MTDGDERAADQDPTQELTPDRSAPMVAQLTRELRLHADEGTVAPDLAARLIVRAHAVRRRRTVAASLTAALAVVVVTLAVTGPALRHADSPPPATRTSTPSPGPTAGLGAGPLRVAYALNSTERDAANGVRSVVVLPPTGPRDSVRVELPPLWWVQRVVPSGSGYVVLGYTDRRAAGTFAAYVTGSGHLTVLHNMAVGAFPADQAGEVFASALVGAPARGGRQGMNLVRPETDTVLETDPRLPFDQVVGVVAPRSFLIRDSTIRDDQHHLHVWLFNGSDQPGPPLAGSRPLWVISDSYADGRILVRTAGDGIHLVHVDGSAGWAWRPPTGAQRADTPSFSPDGTKAYVGTNGGPVVVSAVDGSVITDGSADLVGADVGVVWEDNETLIVTGHTGGTHPEPVLRCSAVSGRCVGLDLPASGLVVADR